MYTTTIDKATIPAELIPGVDAANLKLELTLKELGRAFNVSARWHGGLIHGEQNIFLDLVAVNDAKEYAVKNIGYPALEFLEPDQTKLPSLADQHLAFANELSRLNLDVLFAMRDRAESLSPVGAQ